MFPLTFHGSCSLAQVYHHSLTEIPWFIFTKLSNYLETIPAPLLDRMEVLEVSGYVSEEKAVIASRYLGPQLEAKDASGLAEADIQLPPKPTAVDILIKYYCREWGTEFEETY
jgi:Lon-like ATP-dependent protease